MKHFLDLASVSTAELEHLLKLAVHLKLELQSGGNRPVLQNKILGMVFQKPSLRTRVSFEVGMKQLGGDAIMLGPQEIGLGKRESIADVARVLSGYVNGIMARVFEHQHVTELAKYASVPVINGLSDDTHPCQAMADVLTIYERFGRLNGLKIAYIGDGNNVATSLLYAATHFGLDFAIATPEGYELPARVREKGAALAARSGVDVEWSTHAEQAVRGAHVVYTDTWVSMGQEEETAERRETFAPYQVNKDLMAQADPDAIILHCLPAHRGDEITDEVADGPQSMIFQQAENRLHAQKAILVKLLS
ncbi:ornithine carbamoyltransferase [Phototrophicus methaneseepsis]|uniref:Ornithine carbamoyltransferase n=1 Tax=Phototrophicus methaneseepsis TaxID=2710758 RepID=A0A7S8E7G7_9CHLR|nr:ornithine carbamoyltransferase [Phototrophicus methaneseepsis]QPC81754.1 ornithine carbamoyltransferase [Phototrophicus methaneseepsis]